MYAIVLAGGLGLRLRPYTDDKPKGMVEVLKRPILEYQVEWLRRSGINDVVIACGYRHDAIERYFGDGRRLGINIDYSVEEKPLGTGGAIKKAFSKGGVRGTFVVLNGDTITSINLKDAVGFHRSKGGVATVVVVPFRSPFGIVEFDDEGFVRGFREKPELPHWVNSGIYVLEEEAVKYMPDEGSFEMSVLPRLAEERRLFAYRASGLWKPIDTYKDLVEAEEELTKALFSSLLGS
jgi:NDP-sugar pyrophosphorylase family protein